LNTTEIDAQETEQSTTEEEHISERTWRREKIWELKSKGFSHREILEELGSKDPLLKISLGTITRDLQQKQAQIKANFAKYIEEELPAQHQLALTNLQAVNKESWRIFQKAGDDKTKLAALSTAQQAQMAINQLLGDPEYISKAMSVVGRLRKHLQEQEEVAASE
jgi:hypothetical protein